ncbi:MAG: RES family NAD+ phosphorylase [Chitinophagaceae bacterium]|nr:RES family NAD+ phosphorylase [Chitinophagaceae bacterium]
MFVYRIAKTRDRATDLSGTGAFKAGGRWNSEGKFALYTSEHQALALLELLVHVDESDLPPELFIITLEILNPSLILEIADADLPRDWRMPDNLNLKGMGDSLLANRRYVGFRARSAVIPQEYNVVLNPTHPQFNNVVKLVRTEELDVDQRLLHI